MMFLYPLIALVVANCHKIDDRIRACHMIVYHEGKKKSFATAFI